MKIRCLTLGAFLLVGLTLGVSAQKVDIVEHKGELEKIRQDIEKSRRNLDSLQQVEKRLQKELSDYEQRTSINETVLKRLTDQLTTARKSVSDAKATIERSQKKFQTTRVRYLENLQFYYRGMRRDFSETSAEINIEKNALRRYLYLKALANYDRDQLTRSSEYLKEAEAEYASLTDKEKSLGVAQRKKKREFTISSSQKERRARDLSRLKRKKDAESDRLLSLSEAARQMEDLVARLESERQERKNQTGPENFDYRTGNFQSYKGRLLAPMKGKVIKGFGWSVHPATKLKAYSPGIEIKGAAGQPIAAIASGVAAYTGNLRGYGVFIIIEHEDGYYSTYAGLADTHIETGQVVRQGEVLGVSADGILKFELREGKEAIDPVEWIKLEYLK